MGNLKREHVAKKDIPHTALIIQLGGPAMKIGLGGGAASSIGAGSQSEALDLTPSSVATQKWNAAANK